MLAGHETTANALSWMWYLLALNPDARERMLAEVDEVLSDRRPTFEDVAKLPWTAACFQEAMRVFPPAWVLPRICIEDDVIDGHRIKRGSTILIPINSLHHDERFWPDPEVFDPTRFMPGTSNRTTARRTCHSAAGGGSASASIRADREDPDHGDDESAVRLRPRAGPSRRARGDADASPAPRPEDGRAQAISGGRGHAGGGMSRRVELEGARVVVTGAGSGIGEATALRFAGEGSEVIAVDIDGESAAATAERCGGGAQSRVCDVADAAGGDRARQRAGPVDVLVNNAGVGVAGPFLEAGTEDWDWLIAINLDGVAYGCQAFGAGMVERGHGHIVNVASGAAYFPNRYMTAYCASKAGVVALSQCLRADWAGSGVGVSAICPGVINTPIPSHTRMFGGVAERREQRTRAFRFGHRPTSSPRRSCAPWSATTRRSGRTRIDAHVPRVFRSRRGPFRDSSRARLQVR